MNEIVNELISGLLPIVFIFGGAFLFLVIKNLAKGRKWNYIGNDTSDKM